MVGDRGDDHPGFVGERLAELGARLVPLDRDALPKPWDCPAADLVLVLGSGRSGHDPAQRPVVTAESALLRTLIDAGVPALGICYGAQILARALGGSIVPAAYGEVCYADVESFDARLCPTGPWVQFHSDAFTVPPGARLLGRTPAGPQAFSWVAGRARVLAWQFHPEAVPEELRRWLQNERDYALRHGADPNRFAERAQARRRRSRTDAYALTDAALTWLQVRDGAQGGGSRSHAHPPD